jgi:hypothetical protein
MVKVVVRTIVNAALVIVTVSVVGLDPPPPLPLPHPPKNVAPRAVPIRSSQSVLCLWRLRQNQHRTAAIEVIGTKGNGRPRKLPIFTNVCTVTVVVLADGLGKTSGSGKLQYAQAGRPLQESIIGWLNPFSGTMLMVVVTLCPRGIVAVEGLTECVKSRSRSTSTLAINTHPALSNHFATLTSATPALLASCRFNQQTPHDFV